MIKSRNHQLILLKILSTCLFNLSLQDSNLRVGFYADSCPAAEAVVGDVVREAAAADGNNVPILVRLHFHDCFVEGCDGSILIDNGLDSDEKKAMGHQGVRGFDIVERAKARLEMLCPGTVSCADIVALAARDAISLAKGGPRYAVETGRRDGVVSNRSVAEENMPDVGDSVQKLKAKFMEKGLTAHDLVLLSAAHTIGTTACFFMNQRLYHFPPDGSGPDPSINPDFLPELMSVCPPDGDVNARLAIDRGGAETFDSQILQNIRNGFAVLRSDAALYQDTDTRGVVDSYFGFLSPFFGPNFEADFAASMVKMGRIGVLTGSQGTIRRVCSSVVLPN
ncbi:peroxidase 43 [Andrographis paniculata]|uniref:peroxidase 43 n=1 Tax=Andrographis paniculata TaxID=175694 RepID=UPI0021E81528|nr:peroxidase 43 [Andrographis paniculata]